MNELIEMAPWNDHSEMATVFCQYPKIFGPKSILIEVGIRNRKIKKNSFEHSYITDAVMLKDEGGKIGLYLLEFETLKGIESSYYHYQSQIYRMCVSKEYEDEVKKTILNKIVENDMDKIVPLLRYIGIPKKYYFDLIDKLKIYLGYILVTEKLVEYDEKQIKEKFPKLNIIVFQRRNDNHRGKTVGHIINKSQLFLDERKVEALCNNPIIQNKIFDSNIEKNINNKIASKNESKFKQQNKMDVKKCIKNYRMPFVLLGKALYALYFMIHNGSIDKDSKIKKKDLITACYMNRRSGYTQVNDYLRVFEGIKIGSDVKQNVAFSMMRYDKKYIYYRLHKNLENYKKNIDDMFEKYGFFILRLKGKYVLKVLELLNGNESVEIEMGVREFKNYLSIPETKYVQFSHLKDKVIKKICSDYNKKIFDRINLKVEFKEKKLERKVVAIKINISQLDQKIQ